MLNIQNLISRRATLLYQIFVSKVGVHTNLCSPDDLVHVYESFKLMMPADDDASTSSVRLNRTIFDLIFKSFGCVPNKSDVCWKLVLELLTCGVRLCCEKKADLSEYELSLILLHFWGISRNAGSQAELGFKNQNIIVRALVGNDGNASHRGTLEFAILLMQYCYVETLLHEYDQIIFKPFDFNSLSCSGSLQHKCQQFFQKRSELLNKRCFLRMFCFVLFVSILSIAAGIFVTGLFPEHFFSFV